MRIYTSFDQIDRELEIYKLQAEVDREKVKRSYFYFKEAISPANLALDVAASLTKKVLLSKAVYRFLPFLKG